MLRPQLWLWVRGQHDNLQLERMLGVPHPIDGYDQRWVDNYHGASAALCLCYPRALA